MISVMSFTSRISLITVIFFGCAGCDQITKAIVREHIVVGETRSYLHDTFRLTHAENPGAFLSLGARLPDHMRTILFSVIAAFITLLALGAALWMRDANRFQVAGLALIAAGGFGNWIDRVTQSGHVTDFMNIGIGWLRTGIFNVADMALMAGVVLFLIASQKKAASGNH